VRGGRIRGAHERGVREVALHNECGSRSEIAADRDVVSGVAHHRDKLREVRQVSDNCVDLLDIDHREERLQAGLRVELRVVMHELDAHVRSQVCDGCDNRRVF
jgi:hypothetical protein